jgi:hypothetical protein
MNLFYEEIGKTLEFLLHLTGKYELRYDENKKKYILQYVFNGRPYTVKGRTLDELCFKISFSFNKNDLLKKIKDKRLYWIEYFKHRHTKDEEILFLNALLMKYDYQDDYKNTTKVKDEIEDYDELLQKVKLLLSNLVTIANNEIPKKYIAQLFNWNGADVELIYGVMVGKAHLLSVKELYAIIVRYEAVKLQVLALIEMKHKMLNNIDFLKENYTKTEIMEIFKENGIDLSYPTVLHFINDKKFPEVSLYDFRKMYKLINDLKGVQIND